MESVTEEYKKGKRVEEVEKIYLKGLDLKTNLEGPDADRFTKGVMRDLERHFDNYWSDALGPERWETFKREYLDTR